MKELKILDISVNEILDIVKDARLKGYVQGVDFDFTYYPPKYDEMNALPVYNRCVVFKFYKEELATWFSLMYQ